MATQRAHGSWAAHTLATVRDRGPLRIMHLNLAEAEALFAAAGVHDGDVVRCDHVGRDIVVLRALGKTVIVPLDLCRFIEVDTLPGRASAS
jgi:hypothetical protein